MISATLRDDLNCFEIRTQMLRDPRVTTFLVIVPWRRQRWRKDKRKFALLYDCIEDFNYLEFLCLQPKCMKRWGREQGLKLHFVKLLIALQLIFLVFVVLLTLHVLLAFVTKLTIASDVEIWAIYTHIYIMFVLEKNCLPLQINLKGVYW